jgi:hypothetical protein
MQLNIHNNVGKHFTEHMNIKKLYDYSFMGKMRSVLQSHISNSITDCPERGIKLKDGYSKTEFEEYNISILQKISNLINTLEQLNFIPTFIQEYDTNDNLKKNGINHENYIQYHIENHFLKISSILEQSVILIGEIHNLGIPTKLISLRHLKENKHTKEAPSINILKELDKSIQHLKSKRNKIVHGGEYSDPEMTELIVNDLFDKIDLPKVSDIGINDIIKTKIEFLQNNNENILEFVDLLFQCIEVEFKYQETE